VASLHCTRCAQSVLLCIAKALTTVEGSDSSSSSSSGGGDSGGDSSSGGSCSSGGSDNGSCSSGGSDNCSCSSGSSDNGSSTATSLYQFPPDLGTLLPDLVLACLSDDPDDKLAAACMLVLSALLPQGECNYAKLAAEKETCILGLAGPALVSYYGGPCDAANLLAVGMQHGHMQSTPTALVRLLVSAALPDPRLLVAPLLLLLKAAAAAADSRRLLRAFLQQAVDLATNGMMREPAQLPAWYRYLGLFSCIFDIFNTASEGQGVASHEGVAADLHECGQVAGRMLQAVLALDDSHMPTHGDLSGVQVTLQWMEAFLLRSSIPGEARHLSPFGQGVVQASPGLARQLLQVVSAVLRQYPPTSPLPDPQTTASNSGLLILRAAASADSSICKELRDGPELPTVLLTAPLDAVTRRGLSKLLEGGYPGTQAQLLHAQAVHKERQSVIYRAGTQHTGALGAYIRQHHLVCGNLPEGYSLVWSLQEDRAVANRPCGLFLHS